MALPPIISNSPLFKVLSGAQAKPANETQPQAAPDKPAAQDTVSLSEEALRKLDAINATKVDTADKARQTAEDVRDDLASNPDVTLGFEEASE